VEKGLDDDGNGVGMVMTMATLSTITSGVITMGPRLDPKPPQKQKQATESQREIKQNIKRMRPKPRTMANGDWRQGRPKKDT